MRIDEIGSLEDGQATAPYQDVERALFQAA